MKALRKLGFDIGYLALLTKREVKPLSRWESGFSRRQVKALHHLGLKTDTVQRKLLNGGSTTELIFSKSSRYLDFYTRKFHQTPLKKDQQTMMTEGFLFGYPACCSRNFAENGYTENSFVGHGQEILFHWACPDCRATPSLLPYYRKTYRECQQLFATQRPTVPELLKKSLPAATLSLLFALAPGKARADDPHWYSPSAVEPEGDFLNFQEELFLGTLWGEYYSLPHGPREAQSYSALICSLPKTPSVTCCYLEEAPMDGIENCLVCGQEMNMGGWILHNPMRDTSIFIPNMALHYMEYGSFSFDGTTNAGRVDIQLLKTALAHYDTSHYSIETSNDGDDDGIRDEYEEIFGLETENCDTDGNHLVDGAQISEQLIAAIAALPENCLTFDYAYGVAECSICGMPINMGMVTVKNPNSSDSYSFPIPGLHFLAHGRFAYGMQLYPSDPGEVDAVQLAQVLDVLTWVPHGHPQPGKYQLTLQNYPNPFNASTQIEFSLPTAGHATLIIYNINGQLVRTLKNDHLPAGSHMVRWDGLDQTGGRVASGIYFCRLDHGGSVQARKMLLLK